MYTLACNVSMHMQSSLQIEFSALEEGTQCQNAQDWAGHCCATSAASQLCTSYLDPLFGFVFIDLLVRPHPKGCGSSGTTEYN